MNDNKQLTVTGRIAEPPERQTLTTVTLFPRASVPISEVDFSELELRIIAAMAEDHQDFERSFSV